MTVALNAYMAFFIGLLLLSVCGDWLVTGAAQLGKAFKLSSVFIGVCIIGFGTSVPEMLASATAAIKGSPGLALGNVVGSNIANIGLILATGLLLIPTGINVVQARTDFVLMLLATAVFITICVVFGLSFPSSLVLLAGLLIALILSLRAGKKLYEHAVDDIAPEQEGILPSLCLVGLGLLGLFAGADSVISSAIVIAESWGVPEKIIGLTMVALGTSLPELAATFSAARRGEGGLIVGNVLGSNIFNLLGAAAVAGLFAPISSDGMLSDIAVMAAFSLALAPLFFFQNIWLKGFSFLLLLMYASYIGWVGYSAFA